MHMSSACPGFSPRAYQGDCTKCMEQSWQPPSPQGWVNFVRQSPLVRCFSRKNSHVISVVAIHVSMMLRIPPPQFIDYGTINWISPRGKEPIPYPCTPLHIPLVSPRGLTPGVSWWHVHKLTKRVWMEMIEKRAGMVHSEHCAWLVSNSSHIISSTV